MFHQFVEEVPHSLVVAIILLNYRITDYLIKQNRVGIDADKNAFLPYDFLAVDWVTIIALALTNVTGSTLEIANAQPPVVRHPKYKALILQHV